MSIESLLRTLRFGQDRIPIFRLVDFATLNRKVARGVEAQLHPIAPNLYDYDFDVVAHEHSLIRFSSKHQHTTTSM
jgi:hypothetical protein